MAAILPISGTQGVITVNGFSIYLSKWSGKIEVEIEDFAAFGASADAGGLYWKQQITGYATGEVQIEGKLDATPGSNTVSNKGIFAGTAVTSGYLGFNSTVGLKSITGTINGIDLGQSTDAPFGTISATVKLTGAVFTTTGP